MPVTGIVMATKLEAHPFTESGGFTRVENGPLQLYKSENSYLVISGIGKAAAAIAVSYLVLKYNVSLLFNIGAAGSTTDSYPVGDIKQIGSVIDYDRPTLIGGKPRYLKPDVYEGYETVTLATQDVPVVSAEERDEVGKLAQLVDMEGAGFLQACRTFSVEGHLFKIVTDTPSHTEDREIIDNIKETRSLLFEFFTEKFPLI